MMKIVKIITGICILLSLYIYCPPIFHKVSSNAMKDAYSRIEQRDPIKRASYDVDIHYESTALNPESIEYKNERVDPRSPIHPSEEDLRKLAQENEEDSFSIYKNNRTFDQNFRPGGVRTHSD